MTSPASRFFSVPLSLWGIPYHMRPGQQPADLWRSTLIPDTVMEAVGRHGSRTNLPGPREGWAYLGEPGWYWTLADEQIKQIKAFLEPLRKVGLVPEGPYEWCEIEPDDYYSWYDPRS